MKRVALVVFVMLTTFIVKGQFLMDMIDTTKDVAKGLLSIYKKYDQLRIGGYMQPQFQVVQSKGARGYSGGDFPANSNNRFMLRRGRIRFDYAHFNDENQPTVYFAFQFDGTERGIAIRDFWGRVFENRFQMFAFTIGMFARPFGYEVNLSSGDRESPERGRMSQILMRTERDLGAMISFEPRKKDHPLRFIKIDAGFFNGQGLTSVNDFDSYKDFITRAYLKPYKLNHRLSLSTGLSYFNGGLLQNTKYIYKIQPSGSSYYVDSSASNFGTKTPRKYYGADAQLKWKHNKGQTELRMEYWRGTQSALAASSETPTSLPVEPVYRRPFDGAFLCLLHNFDSHHQVLAKYDWYDPNTKVSGNEIGKPGSFTNAADIRYNTLGVGYINYLNPYTKLIFWYEFIKNESTSLAGYTGDLKDNVLTCRIQFRF